MLLSKRWWILLFAFSFLQNTTAQISDFQFRHLTFEDGMADDKVHDILMDSKGTIWMATHDGLSRYDGLHFKNYKVDSQDTFGLQAAVLMNIKEGENNNYWIAGNGKGLIKFNAEEETFTHFSHDPKNEKSIAADAATSVFIDDEKQIWVGTYDGGLNLFDEKNKTFQRFQMDEDFSPQETFMKNSVSDIIADPLDKNKLWLATPEGIRHFDKVTKEIIKYPIMESYPTFSVKLLAGENGIIWIGTEGHGLVQFNSITKQVDYLSEEWMQAKQVLRKSENELWVSTIGRGLGIYNLKNKTWKYLTDEDSKSNAILSNNIYGIYLDAEGRLWVRDMSKGVSVSNVINAYFSYPMMSDEINKTLVSEKKMAFLPDSTELMVASSFDNRIFVFQKKSQAYFQNKIFPLPVAAPKDCKILDLVSMTDHRTFALAKTKAELLLFQFQKNNNGFVNIPFPEFESINPNQLGAVTLKEDKKGNLWIAFSSGKLLQWNGNKVKEFKVGKFIEKPEGPEICDIVFDKNNNLWAASLTDGVCRLDLEKNEETYFSHKEKWFEGWRINAIAILKNGKIWVGTSASGIYELDPENLSKDNIVKYNQANELLPDDKINNLEVDVNGDVWIATSRGLVKFIIEEKHFLSFGVQNGLTYTFLNNGLELLSNGELIIGQPNGFLTFDPSLMVIDSIAHRVHLSSMMVDGKKYETNHHLDFMDKIELDQEQNYFTIQFSANYFDDAGKRNYKYFLENYDRHWSTTLGSQAEARYTNVPAGKYTFKVMASSEDGKWNQEATEMDIVIHPYWYWSSPMKAIYGLAILGGIIGAWRVQKRRWMLAAQLKNEKAEATRLKDLDEIKSRFFANVSHELRTPITLMLGPIGSLLKNHDLSNKEFTLLKLAEKNGKDLLKLIRSILDLSKMEAGKLELTNDPVLLFSFLRRLVTNFESHAERSSIRFTFEYNIPKELKVELDKSKMEIIINNLISNAIKFTAKEGTITVVADDLENQLQLSVRDTGRGIHEDDLPHVFDRFFQSRQDGRTEGGTGIGLAVSQEYIKLMGGKMWVESELGKGSTFFFQIPRKEVLGWTPETAASENKIIQTPIFENSVEIFSNGKNGTHHSSIMIVEDNHSLRNYLQTILSPHFNLIVVENGQVALEKLTTIFTKRETDISMPDLILSDIMMPVMDGYELLENLRSSSDFNHIPVVMLTARADIQDRLMALRIGVDDYLLKPFDEEELLMRIQNLLNNYAKRKSFVVQVDGETELEELPETKENKITPEDQAWLEQLENTILEFMSDSRFNMDFLGYKMASSRRQLQRKIKKLIGLTPKEYVNEVRLHEARKLLETGKTQSVKATAYQVGYADPQYFSAQFKVRFGKTPSSYLG